MGPFAANSDLFQDYKVHVLEMPARDRTFALCSAGILQRRGPRSRLLSSYGGSDRAVNFTDTTCRQSPRCSHFWSACCATRVNCGRCFGRCIIGRWGSFETLFSGRPLGRRAGHFRQLRPFVSSHDGRAGSGHLEMGAGPRVRREELRFTQHKRRRKRQRRSLPRCPEGQKLKVQVLVLVETQGQRALRRNNAQQ